MKIVLAALMLLLAGCSNYPRDVEGTLDRVRAERVVRVGLIAGDAQRRDRALIQTYLAQVAQETAARPVLINGAADPLLAQLDEGRLDLVIGEVAEDTPWATDVMVIEPIAARALGKARVTLSPIARNGENAWILLLERAVREMKKAA